VLGYGPWAACLGVRLRGVNILLDCGFEPGAALGFLPLHWSPSAPLSATAAAAQPLSPTADGTECLLATMNRRLIVPKKKKLSSHLVGAGCGDGAGEKRGSEASSLASMLRRTGGGGVFVDAPVQHQIPALQLLDPSLVDIVLISNPHSIALM
jgi:hypothetical protein